MTSSGKTTSSPLRVLFLCTGNSCRSQRAEAIVNSRHALAWQAFSAGTKPAGYVHPFAIQALSEIGIEHDGVTKQADQFKCMVFDLVVTACDVAAEDCPLLLGKGKRVHLGFMGPAKVTGTDGEIVSAFRSVRDLIIDKIPQLLDTFKY